MSDFATSALEAIKLGQPVIPLAPNAKMPPRNFAWKREATTNPDKVFCWAERFPQANVGIVAKNLIVLDEDGPKASETMRTLDLFQTLQVRTPRGRHWLYRGSLPPGAPKYLGPELELRGNRGSRPNYTVFPHSTIAGHRYEFSGAEQIATAPKALLALITEKSRKGSDQAWRSGNPIYQGKRNSTLTQLAGGLRRDGFNGAVAIEASLQAANLERCTPPLPEKEVTAIAKSASKWRAAPLWTTDALEFCRDHRLSSPARQVLQALCYHAKVDNRAYPGYKRIQELTGLAPSTIARAIDDLEALGRITVRRSRSGNRYRILSYAPTPRVVTENAGTVSR